MSEWPEVELGAICEFKYGKSLPASKRDGGEHSVYGSNGVVGSHSSSLTVGPTIVIGRKGSFGEVAFSDAACWPIDTTYYIDSTATGADLTWLTYRLRGLGLTGLNRAAAVPGLNREDAYRQRLLLPPADEQRRIASILDQANAVRTKRRQVLAHLDSLTQSIFHDIFGETPGSVPLVRLVEEFRYGTSNKAGDSGYPTLRIPNIIGGSLNLNEIKTVEVREAELERLRLRRDDLLFVRTNGNPDNVGRSSVFDPDLAATAGYSPAPWIFASYLIRARLNDRVRPIVVATYLSGSAGRRQLRRRSKTSAGQYNINIDGLSSIQIPAFPAGHQREFIRRTRSLRIKRVAVQRSLTAHDELFASLQARAFRGEL